MAKVLGVANYQEVIYHEKVAPYFFEGWMTGVGVVLTEDQRAALKETCSSSRSRPSASSASA